MKKTKSNDIMVKKLAIYFLYDDQQIDHGIGNLLRMIIDTKNINRSNMNYDSTNDLCQSMIYNIISLPDFYKRCSSLEIHNEKSCLTHHDFDNSYKVNIKINKNKIVTLIVWYNDDLEYKKIPYNLWPLMNNVDKPIIKTKYNKYKMNDLCNRLSYII